MSYRLHILPLPVEALKANLCFDEDYVVVVGQTAAGDLLLPTCSDVEYLCPAGVPGLRYLGDLGHQGARLDFVFPAPVSYILVATCGNQAPIPQAVYTPPVQVVLSPTEIVRLPVSTAHKGDRVSFQVFTRNETFWGFVTLPYPDTAVFADLNAKINADLLHQEITQVAALGYDMTDLDPLQPNG